MSFFSLLNDYDEQEYAFPDYIKVVRSDRARRLALRLDSKERVMRLTIPKGTPHKHALRFVNQHDDWIQERLLTLPCITPFADGIEVPILGSLRRIEVNFDDTVKRTSVKLQDKIIHVRTNKDDPANRIERYLRKLAKETLTELSHEKAAQIDKTVRSVAVRDTKSRWGSCSADGSLSYSWRLIFAPYEAMDYVVAHEVAHLQHLDHSRAFWNLCTELSDDYVEGKYWMQNHGNELMAFGA